MSTLKYFAFTLVGILILYAGTLAQKPESIPKTATVLETQTLGAKRKMILWMPDPKKHPNEEAKDDIYTCPDQTRGSYYSGVIRVTLIDSKTNKTINTLKIKGDDEYEGNDTIDIPYLIRGGYYYKVPNPDSKIESKPQIMALKDYNGDGRAQEFALFNAEACMGLGTTLIGYSERRDRVIQYPIALKTPEGSRSQFWLDYLFSKTPIHPGYWRYEIDYRGRNGTLDKFTVQYDKSTEKFTASVTRQR
jgi:hypothetical protein